MIPIMDLPIADRPGFCQACYCEKCGQGFYAKARDAVKFSDGRIKCSAEGCGGRLMLQPFWQRVTPCKKCGHAGVPLATAPVQQLLTA